MDNNEQEYKDVAVNLQPLDEKTLLPRSTTRRGRKRKEPMEGGVLKDVPMDTAHTVAAQPAPAPVDAITTMAPATIQLPVSVPMPAPAPTATPAPVPTAQVGGVKIHAKKTAVAEVPKLLPKKKRGGLAPVTLKKPKLLVSPAPPKTLMEKLDPEPKHHTYKRRFKERSISIEMKPVSATRKHRKDLKDAIDAMPVASVKKVLLRKGVLKPRSGKEVPEDILRSMLKDYLLLHSAE